MQLGTVIEFRDDGERPHAELALRNGDRVHLLLDGDGLSITQISAPDGPKILFRADLETIAHLCAALINSPATSPATPLRILTSAIVQLESASEVRTAFEHAAAQVP